MVMMLAGGVDFVGIGITFGNVYDIATDLLDEGDAPLADVVAVLPRPSAPPSLLLILTPKWRCVVFPAFQLFALELTLI